MVVNDSRRQLPCGGGTKKTSKKMPRRSAKMPTKASNNASSSYRKAASLNNRAAHLMDNGEYTQAIACLTYCIRINEQGRPSGRRKERTRHRRAGRFRLVYQQAFRLAAPATIVHWKRVLFTANLFDQSIDLQRTQHAPRTLLFRPNHHPGTSTIAPFEYHQHCITENLSLIHI